jgi:glutathione synthase/RimK-type ligase-like ATP-grasp enzyme
MKVLIVPAVENFNLAHKHLNNAQYDTSYFKNISFAFTAHGPRASYKDSDCKDYDYVWLSSYWGTRDLAYGLHLYLDRHKIKHTRTARSGSKIVDHMIFSLHDIPCPNTFYRNTRNVETFIADLEDVCEYPIVVKDIRGYRGKNTFLTHDRTELEEVVQKLSPGVKVLFQEFVPNDYDWGVLVSNGEVVATEKSIPKEGEFRNNACNGAEEKFVDVDICPENVRKIAIEAADALQLEWCRSDIVVDKNTGEAKLLEVNRYPGITKGTDEVKAVVDFLKDRVK